MKKILFSLILLFQVNALHAQFIKTSKTNTPPVEKPRLFHVNIVNRFAGATIVGGSFEETTVPLSTTMLEFTIGSPKYFSYIALRVSNPLDLEPNTYTDNWGVNTLNAMSIGYALGWGVGFNKVNPITGKGSSFAFIFAGTVDFTIGDEHPLYEENENMWDLGIDMMFRYTHHINKNFGLIFGLDIEYTMKSYDYQQSVTRDYSTYNYIDTKYAHIITYGGTIGFSF